MSDLKGESSRCDDRCNVLLMTLLSYGFIIAVILLYPYQNTQAKPPALSAVIYKKKKKTIWALQENIQGSVAHTLAILYVPLKAK